MTTPIGEGPRLPPSAPPPPPSFSQRVNFCAQTALGTTTALLSAIGEFHFSDQLRASCSQLSSNLRTQASDPETVKQVLALAAQVQRAVQALAGEKNALADVHVATSAATPPFIRESLQALVARWHHSLEALLVQLPLATYIDDPLLLRAINEVDQSMQTKRTRLSLEEQQEFDAFEKELVEFAPLIYQRGLHHQWGICSKSFPSFIDPQIETLRRKHSVLRWGDLLGHSSITEALFSVKRALIRKLDQLYNRAEIWRLVQQEQHRILDQFYRSMSQDEVKIDVQFKDQETHHQGKCPALVKFESKTSGETCKVIYKPRDALIDRDVLCLFRDMGPLHVYESVSPVVLPHYDILCLNQCSFWQYIEGIDTVWRIGAQRGRRIESYKPSDFVENSSAVEDEHRKQLRVQLLAIEGVAAAIHLHDLHGENVLLTEEQSIVPIDFECIGPGQLTSLFSPPVPVKTVELSQEQRNRIDAFQKDALHRTTRLVCMPTKLLAPLCTGSDPHVFAMKVIPNIAENLKRFGYHLTDLENLRLGLYRDLLHGDVPYLSAQEGIVYIGLPEEGLKIGRLITEVGEGS